MPAMVVRRARGAPALEARHVRRIANRMLSALELREAELSVVLCNDAMMCELNARHRGTNQPTDVLAFAMREGNPAPVTGERLLGDVVVSLDTAARQAQKKGHSLLEEVTFLLAHGVLHLLGLDHRNRTEEKHMTALTRELVRVASQRSTATTTLLKALAK